MLPGISATQGNTSHGATCAQKDWICGFVSLQVLAQQRSSQTLFKRTPHHKTNVAVHREYVDVLCEIFFPTNGVEASCIPSGVRDRTGTADYRCAKEQET